MKDMIVGGGLVDFATLHPIGALLMLVAAALVLRRAGRSFAAGRRARSGRASRAL
ncbi:MAG: hypothetical protein JWQ97_3026 [Phenylobacterium sp.]|nr:hypothetical protein [Phenylobacterium sp.]